VIDDDQKLAKLLHQLKTAPWVAVDTEADSLHAYPEKVCLLQISTPAGDELIDPLADLNLDPLLEALCVHELIMHGADYDLRLLRKHHAFVPSAIFDTMLASRLLGCRQFGLTHLAAEYLGVTLDKGSQKANWARRPLTRTMETYARNDTRYLKPLTDRLKMELQEKSRLSWHEEVCARLIADCAKPVSPDPDLVWRVKGSHLLGRAGLAVLRELWQWREVEAVAANRPPFFVLSHEMLVKLAAAVSNACPIEPLLPRHFSDRRRTGLKAAINCGLTVTADRQPNPLRSLNRRPSDAEKRRFNELQKHRDLRAHQLSIDPTLIASRAMLAALAEDWQAHEPDLMNWQRELLK
jgi:ribonuclease D